MCSPPLPLACVRLGNFPCSSFRSALPSTLLPPPVRTRGATPRTAGQARPPSCPASTPTSAWRTGCPRPCGAAASRTHGTRSATRSGGLPCGCEGGGHGRESGARLSRRSAERVAACAGSVGHPAPCLRLTSPLTSAPPPAASRRKFVGCVKQFEKAGRQDDAALISVLRPPVALQDSCDYR